MVSRHAALALLAAIAATGCRTAGVNNLSRPEPIAARPSATVDSLVAQMNRNARSIKSIRDSPSITVVAPNKTEAGLSGKMALELPRNFRLELKSTLHTEADIGSNESGFWFFARRSDPKEYFVGAYDESGASPLEAAFQPDWIIESFGLREISPEEAKSLTLERRQGRNGVVDALVQHRRTKNGQVFTKVTYLDPSTGMVRERQLFEGKQEQNLLARAEILDAKYRRYTIPATPDHEGGSVILPEKIRLEWVPERLRLTVILDHPEINAQVKPSYFEEPTFAGYARKDLGEQAGYARGPTTIRESRPAPPTGVRLQEPVPIGADNQSQTSTDPVPLAPDLLTARERVVGTRLPTAPVSDYEKAAASGWSRAQERSYEP